jgi:transcriptional regulator with XRE-family HTH domain
MSDDATSPAAVGRQLARRRNDLDLTQDQLAERIGIRARTISAIERGNNSIQRSNRSTWERALQLKPGTISRAYAEGSAIEPAEGREVILKESAHGSDNLATRLAEQIQWVKEDNERRIRELEEEVKRLRERDSG